MSSPLIRQYDPKPLPEKLCNTDRLYETMQHRDIDGLVAVAATNSYYLSSFMSPGTAPESHGSVNVVLSRHARDHPIMLLSDGEIAKLQHQPSWIKDIRTYTTLLLPLHAPVDGRELRRFVPEEFLLTPEGQVIAEKYHRHVLDGVVRAMRDVGLTSGRIAFDNAQFGQAVSSQLPDITVVPGEGLIRHTRAEKTAAEIEILRESTRINQTALERSVAAWAPGMTWLDLGHQFHINAVSLGGVFDAPGAMAMANPDSDDPAWHGNVYVEDFELEPGTNIMFDAHGRYNGYCWDGGKTWVVGGESSKETDRVWAATVAAVQEINAKLRPGFKVSEAVDTGLGTFQKFGVPTEGVLIFFHGLGLDHVDQELMTPEGQRTDWAFLDNMLVSTHILVPGSRTERLFIEDIALVRQDGIERFFTWGDELMRG